MRISQLEVKNIGVFDHETIEFLPASKPDKAEIHIFTGVNGSGKSTLLYSLAGTFNEEIPKKRFFYSDKRSYVKIISKEGSFQYYYDSFEREISIKEGVQNTIFDYRSRYSYIISSRGLYKKQWDKSFAVFAYSGFRSLSSENIQAIQEVKSDPLHDSLNFEKPVDSKILLQWIANTKAKVAFALQEGDKEKSKRYQASLRRIENAVSEITGEAVLFTFQYEPLAVGVQVNGENLEFDVLPDGLKSVISWIADLLMRLERLKWADDRAVLDKNFILFLDEIEIHLHPAWQRKILPVVQGLFKNAQIFIATHSPFVVASVDDAWVYKLSLENGRAKIAQVLESKAGSSYPTVLDEIFGINEYFDVETEKQFETFYQLRDAILSGHDGNKENEFKRIATELAQKSVEVNDIIARELRQTERISGKVFELF